MSRPTEFVKESLKPSEPVKRPARRHNVPGPRGYGISIEDGVKLKSDPQTGRVALDESDPYTREYAAKLKSSQTQENGSAKQKSGAQIEADRLMAAAKAKVK